jgi:polyamine oxidase
MLNEHGVLVGISAGKRLSEAGITDFVILEATNRIGGRIHKTEFVGVNVEMGANWVEGVNGDEINPIWSMASGTGGLNLRTFRSDFGHLASNTYKQECVQVLLYVFYTRINVVCTY